MFFKVVNDTPPFKKDRIDVSFFTLHTTVLAEGKIKAVEFINRENMKQVWLVAMVCIMAVASKAKESVHANELSKGMKAAVSNEWISNNASNNKYPGLLFLFTGKNIRAIYCEDGKEGIELSVPLPVACLSKDTIKKIEEKYDNCTIKDATLCIDQNGDIKFYVLLSNPPKPTLLLNVSDYEINDYGE